MAKSRIEGVEKVNKALENIPRGLLKSIAKIIDVNARVLQTHVREEHLTGGTTDSRLRVRSGRLRGSCIPLKTEVKEDRVDGGISFGTVYARTHVGPKGQTTTINPKKGKYLTIPLPGAMTGAGVTKGSAKEGPWGKTFIAKSKAGNLIIFGRLAYQKGKRKGELRGQVIPLFLLKKQVIIRARIHPEDILNWIAPKVEKDLKEKGLKVIE